MLGFHENNNTMINVIGGTYREVNLDYISNNIYGSGLRAVKYLLESSCFNVFFYTAGNEESKKHLENFKQIYKERFEFQIKEMPNILTFKYNFALDSPTIYPSPQLIEQKPHINLSEDNIVCFGMLDSSFSIKANKAVYDPQTSINPILFSKENEAKELVYIVNSTEAEVLSKSKEKKDILNFFFLEEKVKALIIKSGPKGASLFLNENTEITIPSYKTENVYKIGSGDIFTTVFSKYWFEDDLTLEECAQYASKATALYCNDESYLIKESSFDNFNFQEYKYKDLSKKQIYLASPIFSLSEVILIDKIRNSFQDIGVKVFSPYHDIGYGSERFIAEADLKGLNDSDIIFSVLDGLDSGTLVELGYAMAKNMKIIGYHRTESIDSLLMLECANISYFRDLTTAIYQTIWSL